MLWYQEEGVGWLSLSTFSFTERNRERGGLFYFTSEEDFDDNL
jgi:hypothetical protein